MLSSRLTLQGDCLVSAINKKGANIEMSAPRKSDGSVVENTETAAREDRGNIAAAESKCGVRTERRISQQMRLVTFRKNRVDRQVVGEHGIVGRERRGDDFINTDAGPRQTLVEAAYEPGGVGDIRAVKQGGLLHRTANLAAAHKFCDVSEPASELLLEGKPLIRTGTAACKKGQNRRRRQKGD